jgi:hypothetical protein
MMPRPSANKGDEPPSTKTAPAPSKAVAADDVPHDERDIFLVAIEGTDVKTLVPDNGTVIDSKILASETPSA